MSVFALGLNHTTAPLDLRGRFAFAPQQLRRRLAGASAPRLEPGRARSRSCRPATAPSSTSAPRRRRGRRRPLDWLAGIGGVPSQTLRSHAYVLEGASAARHAFRVASGPRLDGPRRAADPRPDEAGGARGRARRHAGHARCSRCSSARSRSPRKCAARPRSARTRSAWRRRRCGWRRSCSRIAAATCGCCSSAPAR